MCVGVNWRCGVVEGGDGVFGGDVGGEANVGE